jgi:exodeoxyribonuclease VII small subunit
MSRKKPENLSVEEALTELEKLVAQLEQGDLPLDQALKAFERGIALTHACQQSLEKAEQKVRILSEKSLDAQTEPFAAD